MAFIPNYQLLFQDTAISGSSSILTHFQAHNNAIFDVAWLPGSRSQVVTVSGDQSAKLWDFENATTAAVVQELRVFRFLFCFLNLNIHATLNFLLLSQEWHLTTYTFSDYAYFQRFLSRVAWHFYINSSCLLRFINKKQIFLLEIKKPKVDIVFDFRGYSRSVKCIEFVPDDPNVFATGSRENAIFIWDIRLETSKKSNHFV